MALHDLGYRSWHGRLNPGWTRWMVITNTAFRGAWKSRWVRRLLFLAWMPAVWFGFGFFVWEQAVQHSDWRYAAARFVRDLGRTSEIADALQMKNPVNARHRVWAWMLQSFFRIPQPVLMVLIVGLIAPPMISQDVRSRAFLLYFSRPLERAEYILGKAATVWAYVILISAAPALCLYVLGVLLSPELNVVQSTWDLPFRILLASAILMIPTSSLALLYSSMTQESRYASFAWFATWILGWLAYSVMRSFEVGFHPQRQLDGHTSVWTLLSLYHCLGRVQRWAFGFQEFHDVLVPAFILATLTIVSVVVVYVRVSAPMRV